ncbi:PAS domain-containing sensor histidine kinase [Hymenobacter sp. BRD67]|uniref:PAS domain-containing sensor histidine kinase n=1 Tax=Hymenobacter sp. BRD67 TaxID=2675877 RepID=UPI00156742B5|nr:PAS domain-containing sensor histidine kinase [Hymenobacter sp. BRD67]QKG51950.1 PAS domain-containing sensor histidine kinase [Hymenobacter sp. BRD67]
MTATVPLADLFTAEDWFTLLEVSLTGIHLVRPLYEPTGAVIVDFALEYLNPAAQRMAGLAEQPGGTLLGHFPHTLAQGIFSYYQRVFETGEQLTYEANYQADGLDNYFKLSARRSGERLVVSFTDTSDQDRSVVEEALRQSQAAERLDLFYIFEQAPVLVALLRSPSHRFEYVNPAYQALFPGRQLVGLEVAKAVPEMPAQGFSALLDNVYQTGETYTGQEMPFTAQPPPGQPPRTIYYNFTYQAYREHGQIVGICIFAFDVTEQVRARRVVEESEQQVRALVESAPFPIGVYVGPELHIRLANEAMLTACGKGPHIIGQRYADVLPELATQAVFEQLYQVLHTGEPLHLRNQQLEVVFEGVPQTFFFNYSFTPLRDTQGAVYGVLNTAADVTDLALARQGLESYAAQLRESETRFRTMADAAPNMVWAVHPDSSIRYINRAFLDFVGLRDEQAYLATGWLPYLHPDELDLTQHTLNQAIAQRTPYVLEHRMLRHDGHYRWLLAQGAPSYLANGELFGYVGSAIDITELKEVNDQLRRTNVDLDTFVYTASHDLKAPITNIEGILLALRDTLPPAVLLDEVVAHLLELLDDTVGRFQFTIAQLTDISRLQLAPAEPAEPVNLATVVDHIRLDLAPALAAADTQLTVAVDSDIVVSFSPANLRSVVYNLLSNAVKYRALDRASQVQLWAEQQDSAVVLVVQDNGLGISELQQRQLFGLFQRLHTHVEGTGVGLYITKRLVENAGGTIQVQSQPNVGTTFRVTFPV